MPLDEAQKQRAKQYFNEHFKCSNCGKSAGYEVDLGYIPLDEPRSSGLMTMPKMMPVLVVGCDSCGSIQFYSAKVGDVTT